MNFLAYLFEEGYQYRSLNAYRSASYLRFRQYIPEGVVFKPTKLAKQSRPEREIAEFFFISFLYNYAQ